MTLISLLLAVAAERLVPEWQRWRQWDWFRKYLQTLSERFGNHGWWTQPTGVIAILAPLVGATALFQHLLAEGMAGVPGMLFSIGALFYCLGPRELLADLDRYLDALAIGDEERQFEMASSIINARGSNPTPMMVALASFSESGKRFFHALFWFVVLGPMGAVLYRANRYLIDVGRNSEAHQPQVAVAERLDFLLGWIPARLAALAFALVGSFDDCCATWESRSADENSGENDRFMEEMGSSAVRMLASEEGDGSAHVLASQALIRRSMLLWVAAIAVFTLFGWLI